MYKLVYFSLIVNCVLFVQKYGYNWQFHVPYLGSFLNKWQLGGGGDSRWQNILQGGNSFGKNVKNA